MGLILIITMLKKIAYYLKKINLSKDFIHSYIPKVRGIKKIMEMDIGIDDHIINRDISKFLLKTKVLEIEDLLKIKN